MYLFLFLKSNLLFIKRHFGDKTSLQLHLVSSFLITVFTHPFIQQSVLLTSQMCILAEPTARKGHISVKGQFPCQLAKRHQGEKQPTMEN